MQSSTAAVTLSASVPDMSVDIWPHLDTAGCQKFVSGRLQFRVRLGSKLGLVSLGRSSSRHGESREGNILAGEMSCTPITDV